MREHINCRECDESPTGNCDAYDKAHREYEMHWRDNTAMNRWWKELDEKPAAQEFEKFIQNCPPHIPFKWWRHKLPRADRVRLDRLFFEAQRESQPPTDKVRQRWVWHGVSYSEPEYRKDSDWVSSHLQLMIAELDRRVEDAKAEGIPQGDPYLIALCKFRRELRRDLRREQRRAAAKAKAAHA
jgi:hypothetical protein